MPLDPQAQALLEQMKAMGFTYTPDLTVGRARETLKAMQAVRGAGEPGFKRNRFRLASCFRLI